MNRKKTELMKEILTSDSVHLYLSDLELNAQRFTLEMLRIKRVVNELVEREKEIQGADVVVSPKDVCPYLLNLVYVDQGGGMGMGMAPPGGGGPGGMPPPPGADGGGAPEPGGGMMGKNLPGGGGGGAAAPPADVLAPLVKQLKENELLKIMGEFPSWKINEYNEWHQTYLKRRAEFVPRDKPVLVD
jgi:hypothetical protein